MGLLLSHTHLHYENNSLQSLFYTDRLIIMYAVCDSSTEPEVILPKNKKAF